MRKKDFIELPEVIEVLGTNYVLSSEEQDKLTSLIELLGCNIRGANAKSVAHFIKYNLDDWYGRIRSLKKLGFTIREERYILLMGFEAGSEYWASISQKKKQSQTENSYVAKHGTVRGKEIWEEMNRKRSISTFNKDYWINQGFSEDDAIKQVSLVSKKGSTKGNAVQKQQREEDYESWAKKMPTTIHYWIEQGFSAEEACIKLKEYQTTFSKEVCISKYGEVEGLKRWEARQVKWLGSISDVNMRTNFGSASKASLKYFKPLMQILDNHSIEYHIGIENNSEYSLYGNNRMNLYDFVIPSLKLCIEYNGEKFHPNPIWQTENLDRWNTWKQLYTDKTAAEIFVFDQMKINLMKDNGFEVYEIWSGLDYKKQLGKMVEVINEKLK